MSDTEAKAIPPAPEVEAQSETSAPAEIELNLNDFREMPNRLTEINELMRAKDIQLTAMEERIKKLETSPRIKIIDKAISNEDSMQMQLDAFKKDILNKYKPVR